MEIQYLASRKKAEPIKLQMGQCSFSISGHRLVRMLNCCPCSGGQWQPPVAVKSRKSLYNPLASRGLGGEGETAAAAAVGVQAWGLLRRYQPPLSERRAHRHPHRVRVGGLRGRGMAARAAEPAFGSVCSAFGTRRKESKWKCFFLKVRHTLCTPYSITDFYKLLNVVHPHTRSLIVFSSCVWAHIPQR